MRSSSRERIVEGFKLKSIDSIMWINGLWKSMNTRDKKRGRLSPQLMTHRENDRNLDKNAQITRETSVLPRGWDCSRNLFARTESACSYYTKKSERGFSADARMREIFENDRVRFSRDTRQGRRMTRAFSRYRENSIQHNSMLHIQSM